MMIRVAAFVAVISDPRPVNALHTAGQCTGDDALMQREDDHSRRKETVKAFQDDEQRE